MEKEAHTASHGKKCGSKQRSAGKIPFTIDSSSSLKEQSGMPGRGPEYLAALGWWQEVSGVYPAGGSLIERKYLVETIASGKDGVMKAHGRKKGGEEERK